MIGININLYGYNNGQPGSNLTYQQIFCQYENKTWWDFALQQRLSQYENGAW